VDRLEAAVALRPWEAEAAVVVRPLAALALRSTEAEMWAPLRCSQERRLFAQVRARERASLAAPPHRSVSAQEGREAAL
jgi:hypothetical protein